MLIDFAGSRAYSYFCCKSAGRSAFLITERQPWAVKNCELIIVNWSEATYGTRYQTNGFSHKNNS